MDPSRFVAVTSTNAAKIFNLYPRKGCIAVGSDADLVIWDPNLTKTISVTTHHSAVDFNIFEGMACRGGPEYVIANGRVAVDEGQLKAVQGYGTFLPTPSFSPFVYDAVAEREQNRKNGVANGGEKSSNGDAASVASSAAPSVAGSVPPVQAAVICKIPLSPSAPNIPIQPIVRTTVPP